MMKKKNIILILILIVLSIFLVQYWSKQQEQVEKERLEQIQKERVEKAEQERLERIEKEKAEQERLEKLEAEKKKTSFTWHTDVNKAINISVQTGKPLFLFFTGSDWCGWCKRLVKEVFVKPEFATWATKNIVLVELDFPRGGSKNKIYNQLQKDCISINKLQRFGYPTGWFVSPLQENGKITLNSLGTLGYVAGGPKAWVAGANKILKNK